MNCRICLKDWSRRCEHLVERLSETLEFDVSAGQLYPFSQMIGRDSVSGSGHPIEWLDGPVGQDRAAHEGQENGNRNRQQERTQQPALNTANVRE